MNTQIIDAQVGYGFVQSQKTHIETQVNETTYADIQYQQLVPVDTSANPFTQTVTYYSSDKFGKAEWINGNSDDIPLAGTERGKKSTSVYTAGIGYGYGWEEVQQAIQAGSNLQADDAMAARRAYEEMVDGVALVGDEDKGFTGLFNNTAVTAAAVTNGDWGNTATTEDDMLADVNDLILGVANDTDYSSMADTLLIPHDKLNIIATRRLGDTQGTVLQFLRQNNTYTAMTGQPLTIRSVRGLKTAGAGGVSRMAAYRRAPDVLKMHIPMPHRFLPVFQSGPLNWVVPGVFRLGGLDIRKTKEVRYGDGI